MESANSATATALSTIELNKDNGWNVSIGSKIEYNLTGKVPATAPTYDYYYFIFNDTLSKGLTFNNDVIVWIDADNDGELDEAEKLTADTDYKVYTETTEDEEPSIRCSD